MSAVLMKLPDNIINFKLPKKPKVVEKEYVQYEKKYCVLPFRAASDPRLHHQTLRVLMAICSFTNRAGITWVGQKTIAEHLKIHQQSVSRQFKLLEKHGYLETIHKGFKGERADTRRVIFDPDLKTEDVIAVASSGDEDVRPPHLIKQEEREMDEQARKRMVEQALQMSKGFGKPNVFKVNTEPKSSDSITVREMKMKIAEHKEKVKRVAKVKREQLSKDADELLSMAEKIVVKPVDNSLHTQHHTQHIKDELQPLDVVQRYEGTISNKDIYKNISNKLINIYKLKVGVINKVERVMTTEDQDAMLSMVEAGLNEVMWEMIVDDTLHNCQRTRKEPPHRITYFKEAIMRTLNTSVA